MELKDFKAKAVRERLNIGKEFGKIFTFIDFANVNKWFERDTQDWSDRPLAVDQVLDIDIDKLQSFTDLFSDRVRLYYGQDPVNEGSVKFTGALRIVFDSKNVVTKDLQKIKHYLAPKEEGIEYEKTDREGKKFVEIRKCNFDVEIAVDAFKMMKHYDTFCIFSGDADFVYLHNFLRKHGKKIIIIKGGHITSKLRKTADLVINAQQIKKDIARIKKTKT
jgi:hypothetical protein